MRHLLEVLGDRLEVSVISTSGLLSWNTQAPPELVALIECLNSHEDDIDLLCLMETTSLSYLQVLKGCNSPVSRSAEDASSDYREF